jgi:hypothetical protein
MWELISAVPSLLKGIFGTVNHVTDALANEKIAVVNATTEQERIAAQERVNTLTLRRDVLINEGRFTRLNVVMRFAIACCVLVILAKILVWDKSVGPFFGCVGKLTTPEALECRQFVTDALDPNLWHLIMVVVGFYFLSEAATILRRGSK